MVDGYYVPSEILRLKDYSGTGWYCVFYGSPNIYKALKANAGWPWVDEDKALQLSGNKLLVDLKVLMW